MCQEQNQNAPLRHTERKHYFCVYFQNQTETLLLVFKQLSPPILCIVFPYPTKEHCKTYFSSHGLHLFSRPREQM